MRNADGLAVEWVGDSSARVLGDHEPEIQRDSKHPSGSPRHCSRTNQNARIAKAPKLR